MYHDIGHRRIVDGKAYFITDAKAKRYLFWHPCKSWYDLRGFSGIDLIFPETKGNGIDERYFPFPKEMVNAANQRPTVAKADVYHACGTCYLREV